MKSLVVGDCVALLEGAAEAPLFDAVVTSPPYAQQRSSQYGGISEAEYPAWTVRWLNAVGRVLNEKGSVAVVIRSHVKDGAVSDYVLRTRLAVREAGWYEPEELLWIKPDGPPLGHTGRPRRSWEHILWFSRSRDPYCNPTANGKASKSLGLNASRKGFNDWLHQGQESVDRSGLARCRDFVEVPVRTANQADYNNHPAQYPEDLAMWIMRLLVPSGGMVLDPFMGSGTTAVAAKRLDRGWMGIEMQEEYARIAKRRVEEVEIGDLIEWRSPITFADGYITLPPQGE